MVSPKIRVHFGVIMLRVAVTLSKLGRKCVVSPSFAAFQLKKQCDRNRQHVNSCKIWWWCTVFVLLAFFH